MLEKLKALVPSVRWFVGLVVGALVLIWFWHPFWNFVTEIAKKADGLFK